MDNPDTRKRLLIRWTLINATLILRKEKIPANTYRQLRKAMNKIHVRLLSRKILDGIGEALTSISDRIHNRKG